MTRAEVAAALQQKTQAADHASNLLQSVILQFNVLNDVAVKRMRDMSAERRRGRGRNE